MNTLRRKIGLGLLATVVACSMVFSAMLLAPNVVYATPKDDICIGAGGTQGSITDPKTGVVTNGCVSPTGTPDVDTTLKTAINLFSAVTGIIAVIMIMIAGVKYMTSQGEAGQINSAKNTILYAAIGIVIVALAQLIVRFVLGRFTS